MRKIYLMLFISFGLIIATANAQVSTYLFAQTAGTYSEISGGTVLGTIANDEEVFSNNTTGAAGPITSTGFPIGFNFTYNGTSFDRFAVATNGYIVVGTGSFTIANTLSTAISSSTAGLTNLLSVFNQDLEGQAGSELSYLLIGSAPNRVLVVQWKEYKRYVGTDPMNFNFQIKLHETTNVIDYVYGTMTTITPYNSQIGIKGSSNADFNNRTTTTDWAATTAGALNNATCALTTTVFPASGQTYTFTPAPPCVAPTSLSASISGTPAISTIAGSFTAAPVAPSGYIVIRTLLNTQPVPVDGTNYTAGNSYAIGFLEYNNALPGPWTSTLLTASTTYYYWVFSYNNTLCSGGIKYSALATTASITTNAAGNITSTLVGGLWSAPATWVSGVVPTIGDAVIIADGATVTIDVDATAYSLIIGQGSSGILNYEAITGRMLTVQTNVTIAPGAAFNTAASGAVTTHTLNLNGNLVNNGVLDFAIATAGTGIFVTGNINSSFTGTGTTTDLYTLNIVKSARNVEVELNLSNFSVSDLSVSATGGLLPSSGTGTLKISGTNTFSGSLWSAAAYSIPSTLGFWLNNPNFSVTGQTGSASVSGLFRISQGAYNIGTLADNSMGFNAASVIIVEGGTVNSTGRFGVGNAANVFSYTQSAGTINVGRVGNTSTTLAAFDLGTSSLSTISMGGGSIIVTIASTAATNPRDYRNQAGTGITGVTAGTLQLGDAGSGAAKSFNIAGVVPNLIVTNTSAGHTATFGAPVTYNNVSLNFTINAGAALNFGNNVFLFSGTNITNDGTLTHNGASSRFIMFKPNTNVTYTGAGVVTAPMTSFELQNDLNFTFDPSVSNVVVSRVIIFSGSFVNANKLTIGNGGTTSATIQIGNTTTPTNAGIFDMAPAFNLGTGGQNISYLRVTNPRSTGFEINPGRVLNNLSVDDNVNALTIAGGSLLVTGTLTLTNGVVNNSAVNLITVGLDAVTLGTIVRTNGMINGSLKKWYAASTGTATFPLGDGVNYKPATLNFTTAPATGGTLTASFSSAAPSFPNAIPLTEGSLIVNGVSNQGSWIVQSGNGLTGGNYTATFTGNGATDVIDYTKTVLIKRPSAGGDWTLDGIHVTTAGSNTAPVVSRTDLTGFSEFAIGGQNFVALPISIQYFKGSKQSNGHLLDWKVTCYSSPSVTMQLERSADGRNFSNINSQSETAARCLQPFNYTDVSPLAGINYYRLKSVDIDGRITYSNIVALINKDKGFEIVSLVPNPVHNDAILSVSSAVKSSIEIVISDLSGKQLNRQKLSLIAGNNLLQINLRSLPAGTYQVTGITGDGELKTLRFVKQ